MDAIAELSAAVRARNAECKAAQNAAVVAPLQKRIEELEAENAALKAELAAQGGTKAAKKRGK